MARWLLAVGVLCASVPFIAAAGPAQAATTPPAKSAQLNSGGFPTWFQDANGVRAELCLDPNDTNCLAPLAAPGIYDPNLPLSFPSNYPDELFYSAVDSQPVTATDASCVDAGGTISVHLALEAAYFSGTPAPGDQAVFGRIRVNAQAGSGLCGGTWYTFRTPYGPITVQTQADGSIVGGAASAATVDVGCFPTPAVPCAFNETLAAPVLQIGFLQQVSGAAAGYLGDGSFSPVTGGLAGYNHLEVVKWAEGTAPAASGYQADCTGTCTVVADTANFAVLTKLAGPLSADVTTADFGGQALATTSAAKAITITNLGAGALGLDSSTIDQVEITGADAAQFGLTSTTCSVASVTAPVAATPLGRDEACQVSVTFTPAATAVAVASLDIHANGSATPFSIALKGTGVTSTAAAAATTSTDNLVFGGVRLTTVSSTQSVTITNTGDAPLLAVPSVVASADSSAFRISANTCAGGYVPAGATCTVSVLFVPGRVGTYSELLHFETNAPSGAVTVGMQAVGTGGVAAVSSTLDPVNTFPTWYQDETGIRLGQCDDPTNPLCIAAPVAGPVSFPSNYPDEWFYYIAQSEPMDVADPACNLEPGGVFVEAGTEAAFLGPIGPNEGITFGRLRIVSAGGLCPDTEYLFTHPYGRTVIAVDALGRIKPAAGTTDVGCAAAPCDFTAALSSPVSEGYLTQTVRPAGYLGDPVAPSTVTGAPYIDPLTGQPANHFTIHRLTDAGTVGDLIGSTDRFGVSGRLVGPMVVSPAAHDFGATAVDGGTISQDFTFTNEGIAPVDATGVTVSGVAAADYTVAANSCSPVAPAAATTLAIGASCAVTVTFDPSATGVRTATLTLVHTGRNNPLEAALTGVGGAGAGLPAISTPLPTISFPALQAGQVSASAQVVISNVGGQAPLVVGTTPRTGTNPGQFQVTNQCPGNNVARPGTVAPGDTCVVLVRFAPTTAGAKTATLTVNSNAGAITVTLNGRGSTDVPTQSTTTTDAGFPTWFQDGNGVRLEQCMSNDGNCVLLADATFNPAQPVTFPANYPLESFYSFAESELLPFPADAACGAAGGFAMVRVATEATFTAAAPQAGTQTWFNRLRVTANGLCPNTTYSFTHPYGVTSLTTDGNGDIRAKDGTFDLANVLGSAPTAPGVLVWDPNVAPAAPAGYLGDARTPHQVVGSQFRLDPAGEPVNYFQIDGPSGVVARTDKFVVAGRQAGPVVSSIASKDFGVVEIGRQSTAQLVTVTNLGVTPVSALSATITGANANLFTFVNTGCNTAGTTLNRDGSCNVSVRFVPSAGTAVGVKTATLTISHDGLRSPISIPLTGTANAVQTPALTVTPTSMAFGTITAGTTSTSQTLTIRNSGTGALRLGALVLGGTNPTQYLLVASSSATACPINGTLPTANLAAGASCTVTVAFAPTSGGAKPATIAVSATDRVAADGHVPVVIPNVNVSLTGTGGQGTIRLSATTLAIGSRAGTATSARVTLTNAGTAPFSLNGAPVFTITGITANNPVPRFTAAQTGCNNVAVGRNCTVTVTFTPPAGTPANSVFSVNIAMTSNASNNPVTLRVNGTVR
ncbi:MAG: choice-of-anchor D domain-containing protein [Ilumatobacteraceae bacterium]